MNKKIFYGIAVCVVAAMAAWNVNMNSNEGLSDVSLANVEALASESDIYSCLVLTSCYFNSMYDWPYILDYKWYSISQGMYIYVGGVIKNEMRCNTNN